MGHRFREGRLTLAGVDLENVKHGLMVVPGKPGIWRARRALNTRSSASVVELTTRAWHDILGVDHHQS